MFTSFFRILGKNADPTHKKKKLDLTLTYKEEAKRGKLDGSDSGIAEVEPVRSEHAHEDRQDEGRVETIARVTMIINKND